MAIVWGASFVVIIVCFSLELQPTSTPVAVLLIGAIGVAAAIALSYTALRLRVGGSLFSNVLQAQGYPIGDPESGRRLADSEEWVAWKRFRRGEIDRLAYEHARARRRFAHGEISAQEYREIAKELDVARAAKAPPPGRPPPTA
jgi:hypothetical protein